MAPVTAAIDPASAANTPISKQEIALAKTPSSRSAAEIMISLGVLGDLGERIFFSASSVDMFRFLNVMALV
jgi:hypothetical protein